MKGILKKHDALEVSEVEVKKIKTTIKKVVFKENVLDNGKSNDNADTAERINDLTCVLKSLLKKVENGLEGTNVVNSFQSKMAEGKANESVSLLEEDKSAESELGPTQAKEVEKWTCTFCARPYARKGWLTKHMEAEHGDQLNGTCDTTLSESQFNPIRNSTTEDVVKGNSKGRDRVRRREDEEEIESEEARSLRMRVKLEDIEERVENSQGVMETESDKEEDEGETQAVIKKALEAKEAAEKFLQSFSDDSLNLDKSLDEDRDKQINQLKRMLKDKDKLLHIKNGKFVELEITNGEMADEIDRLQKEISKMIANEARLKEQMDRLVERTDTITMKTGASPSKIQLKSSVLMMTETCDDLRAKIKYLEECLLLEKREVVRLKREAESMIKVKTSLEEAIAEQDNLKEEVEKKDKLISQLKKKIKCEDKNCDKGKKCGFAHHLNDRKRSQSRMRADMKRTLCVFYEAGYCRNSEENCNYGHFTREKGDKESDRTRSSHRRDERGHTSRRDERSRDNLTHLYSSISSAEESRKEEKNRSGFSRNESSKSEERFDRFRNDRSGRGGAGIPQSPDRSGRGGNRPQSTYREEERMEWEGNGQGVSDSSRPEAPRSRHQGNRDLYERVNNEHRWNGNRGFGHRGGSQRRGGYQREENQERWGRDRSRNSRDSGQSHWGQQRPQYPRRNRFDQGRR